MWTLDSVVATLCQGHAVFNEPVLRAYLDEGGNDDLEYDPAVAWLAYEIRRYLRLLHMNSRFTHEKHGS